MEKVKQSVPKCEGQFGVLDQVTEEGIVNNRYAQIKLNTTRRSEGLALENMLAIMEDEFVEYKAEFPAMMKELLLDQVRPLHISMENFYSHSPVKIVDPTSPNKPPRSFRSTFGLSNVIVGNLTCKNDQIEIMEILFKMNNVEDEMLIKRLNDLKLDCRSFSKDVIESFTGIPEFMKLMIKRWNL